MKCDEFDDRVHSLLDDRVRIDADPMLLEHADACAKCRGMLGTYGDLLAGLDSCEIPELSPDFTRRVVDQVHAERVVTVRPARRTRRWLALAAVAIAAGLLIALIPYLGSRTTPNQPIAPRVVEDDGQEDLEPSLAEQPKDESPHDDATQVAHGEVDAESEAEQLRIVLNQLTPKLPYDRLVPVDQIRGGLRPITSSLAVAIDALRSTIPLGRQDHAKEPTGDSANFRFMSPGWISV
ncbi:MAG: hypothetical protein H8E44_12040 [Planctomycetes bacterium]|nr:hypothetical protein [Planctomycetota bacterium]MBL7044706.1 hypothetical protein [Pirellulaceae bacterium]